MSYFQLKAPLLNDFPGDMPGPEEFNEEDDSQERILPDEDDDYEDTDLLLDDDDDYLGEEE
jgi:hypothetical protein